MSVTLLKCLLPLACAVHLALLYCDRIITLLDGGRFDFRLLNNKKLSLSWAQRLRKGRCARWCWVRLR